jgi:antitoxin component of MazEF toxin-antitoxin module
MQIYTETLTDTLSVKLPQDLITMLEIEPGDTVIFQVKDSQARICGLELSDFGQMEATDNPFLRET